MTQQFMDTVTLSGTRITDAGYLVADVLCARTGCQDYMAAEMGLAGDGVVTVYRPDSAVFSKDSMATFVGKPVTIGHPTMPVTADNWKDHAVGDIGEEVARDGEAIRVSIKLMDAAAIKQVQDGLREISMGYTTPIEMQDGAAPDGTPYQAVQTGPIKINHLALVDRARGGTKLRIGDAEKWGLSPITQSNKKEDFMSDALKTVVLGDKTAQVAVADAATIEQFKVDSAKALVDMETAHDKEMAAKDAELDKSKKALADAEAKILSDADLDKRVADRADLVATAKKIHADVKTDGVSDAEIRKSVVVSKMGDAADGKSEAYIDARFDVLAEDVASKDVVADAITNQPAAPASGVINMADQYAKRDARLVNAHKAKKEA